MRMSIFMRIVFFGSLWGLAEGSLGFILHMVSRALPVPGFAGFIMFPLTCIFMLSAYGSTGRLSSIPLSALIAAAAKTLSLLHPAVTPIFVVNPVLAIIAEGAAVWLLAAAGSSVLPLGRVSSAVIGGLSAAVGWRLLFLLMIFLLPVQKGILNKGTEALLTFILFEGVVSGLLLGTGLFFRYGFKQRSLVSLSALRLHPIIPGALFVASTLVQLAGSI